MFEYNTNLYKNNYRSLLSFGGRKFVVREVGNYFQKLKINYQIEKEVCHEYYSVNQQFFPKIVRAISEKIDNFVQLLDQPLCEIKKTDIWGIFNESGKLMGAISAKKNMKQYYISGLYFDKGLKRTKFVKEVFCELINKIKEKAQERELPLISCNAYKRALPTVRLYKKLGFREVKKLSGNSLYSDSLDLEVKTSELGKNLIKK